MFAEEIKLASESGKQKEVVLQCFHPFLWLHLTPPGFPAPIAGKMASTHTHRVWGGSVPLIIDITQCTKSALLL